MGKGKKGYELIGRLIEVAGVAVVLGLMLAPGMSSAISAGDIQARLAEISGDSLDTIEVVYDEPGGSVSWIKGRFASAVPDDRLESAYRFMEDNRDILGIETPRRDMKRFLETTDESAGTSHVYFEQRIEGIPVWNHRIAFHFSRDGSIYAINGRYVPAPAPNLHRPVLSADEAFSRARHDFMGSGPKGPVSPEALLDGKDNERAVFDQTIPPRTEQIYFADRAGNLRLSFLVRFSVGTPPGDWLYIIDAETGGILLKFNNIQTAGPATGTGIDLKGATVTLHDYKDVDNKYKLIDTSKYMYTHNPTLHPYSTYKGVIEVRNCKNAVDAKGEPVLSSSCAPEADPNGDNVFDDFGNPDVKSNARAAVSLARGFSDVYDFWFRHFGRNGVDGKGLSLVGNIHYGKNYANGFWRPDWKMIFFGDSDAAWPYTRGNDWIAHESGHGVTQFEVPPDSLIYINESGGLNESYSDFAAVAIDYDDWDFGGEVGDLVPSRYINDPAKSNPPQPKDMYDFFLMPLEIDNGGVHYNSGVGNYAFYLLSKALPAVAPALDGRITAYKIAYRAYKYIAANPDATFREWGIAMKQAAVDLYGPGKEYAATVNALNAVHVPQARILAYDNGLFLGSDGKPIPWPIGLAVGYPCVSVQFDRPAANARLKTVAVEFATPVSGGYDIFVCSAHPDGSPNSASCPTPVITVPDTSVFHTGLFTNIVLPQAVSVDQKFHIGVCYDDNSYEIPKILLDNSDSPSSRTWIGTWDFINPYLVWVNLFKSYGITNNLMIRAIMEQPAGVVPAAPLLATPANAAKIAGTQATFTWKASAGATKYYLEVNSSGAWGAATRKFYGVVTTTSKTVTGLPNNGTVYSWRVWAGNTNGWGAASLTRTFTNGTKKAPAVISLAPANPVSRAGTATSFTAVYSDGNGFADLASVELLVSPGGSVANGIRVKYDRELNKLYLFNNAGTAVLAPGCAPGAAVTVQNTQGKLNCAATTVSGALNQLSVIWNITPKAAFASSTARQLKLRATDRTSAATAWIQKGTWKINP